MTGSRTVKIGSRKSQLAMIQTESVKKKLEEKFPDIVFEIVTMETLGDKILDTPLSKIGEKSLFTKELELALEQNHVDLVVHSLKDLPTALAEGMVIGAVLERESPLDAVILHPKYKEHKSLATLPKDSVIGTSSLRRAAQLKRAFPHLKFQDVRGNLNTRLRKLDEGDTYAALILAAAGIERMGWTDRMSMTLGAEHCMYAVSQGALGVECRATDRETLRLLGGLNHYPTLMKVIAERAFLKKLEGGCSIPVAVNTDFTNNVLNLRGGVFSLDGQESVIDTQTVTLPEENEPSAKRPTNNGTRQFVGIASHEISYDALGRSEGLGTSLAETMLKNGADTILREARAVTDIELAKRKEQLEKKKEKLNQQKVEEATKVVS